LAIKVKSSQSVPGWYMMDNFYGFSRILTSILNYVDNVDNTGED